MLRRVVDGDDGLVSEVLHQLDLPIGERADDLPVNANSADQLTVFEHRYADHRPIAGEFGGGNDRWITLDVGLHPPNVGGLHNLFGSGDPSKGSVRLRSDQWFALARVGICGRGVVHGNHAERIAVAKEQRTERRLTDANSVRENGPEYRLQARAPKIPFVVVSNWQGIGIYGAPTGRTGRALTKVTTSSQPIGR